MRKQNNTKSAFRLTLTILSIFALPALAENGGDWSAGGGDGAKVELKQYRFQQHWSQGYERLVLEFNRRDRSSRTDPNVRTSQAGGEWMVAVDSASLTGALPESLINESYQYKSKFLGPLSINLDGKANGFNLRIATKRSEAVPHAFWLASPPRLVIDIYRNASAKNSGGERRSASVGYDAEHPTFTRTKGQFGGFGNYLCFPAAAKVGLSVVFQAQSAHIEELKNVQVNMGTAGEVPAGNDTIVCYSKDSQVHAQLSFEKRDWYAEMNRPPEPQPVAAAAPVASAPFAKAAPAGIAAAKPKGPEAADDLSAGASGSMGKMSLPGLPGGSALKSGGLPGGGSLLPSAKAKPAASLLPPGK